MAMPLRDDPAITDNRTKDTNQRRIWREQRRARYHANPEKERELIYRRRKENPERHAEAVKLSRKRSRRGIQRAYRKADAA